MNPIPPGITKRFHLFRLARNVLRLSIRNIATRRRPLEVGVELDAVRRVEVDALHLAAEAFPFGEGGHHLQAVAQDHAVAPVGVVLVELGPGAFARQPVEVGEQVELPRLTGFLLLTRLPDQIVDQHFRMDLLLDV